MANPSSAKNKIKDVVPKLHEMVEKNVFGDVWERPQLTKRERSMITITALIAQGITAPLRSHMEQGLDHGMTVDEIREVILHTAIYAGFPASVSASLIARPLFEDLGVIDPL